MVKGWAASLAGVCCGVGLWAPLAASAALEQREASALNGTPTTVVYDTASGLEWLTPRATMGLSFEAAAASGFADSGYRFATASELVTLLEHAGFNVSALPTSESTPYTTTEPGSVAALRALVGLLGDTSGAQQPLASNAFSNLWVSAILADVAPLDGYLYAGAHYAATLDAREDTAVVFVPGNRFPTSDGNVGSFLVRNVSAVPEPGAAAMLVLGLLTGALRRPRRPA